MKKSEKILSETHIPLNTGENDRMTIENNVLLKHIIDNDLKHIWAWLKGIAIAVLGIAGAVIKMCFK